MFLKSINVRFKDLRNKIDIKIAVVFVIFLMFNVLKTSIFGLLITNPSSYYSSLLYRFFISMLMTLLLYAFIFRFKSRFLIVLFYILQTLYLFANLSYYLYFHNYLHLFQSSVLFTEGLGAAGHLAVPKDPKLLLLLLDLPAFIYIIYLYKSIHTINMTLKAYRKAFVLLSIITVLLTEGWHLVHNFSLPDLLKEYPSNETIVVERYGTLVNSAADAWANRNDQMLINSLKYGKTISKNSEDKKKPNFIIIQVESMDSNIINKKYNNKYIMPYMASLSKKSIYYPYALSYHKAGGTSDSEFSIFNSIEPLDSFPSIKINSYTHPNSFIRLLSDNDYHTAVFHGNIATYFSRNKAYPKIGFKDFHDMIRMGLKDVGWGAPDLDVFKYTVKQLKNQSSPFLYYIITMTSHGPFTNARYYYDNNDYDRINDVVVRDYFNSMSYVDRSLSYLVDYIKQNLDNTYIIILGDHTPGISNKTFKQASFYMDNKYFEFIPILILTPDRQIRQENKLCASFIDIAPTILDASGISFRYKSDGSNLLKSEVFGAIPYKGTRYDRALLFDKVSKD